MRSRSTKAAAGQYHTSSLPSLTAASMSLLSLHTALSTI
jgi:hypothetical protein